VSWKNLSLDINTGAFGVSSTVQWELIALHFCLLEKARLAQAFDSNIQHSPWDITELP